jgi:hypothetical protein
MCSSGFRCRNFRVTMNLDRSTKLRLTTTPAIATYTLLPAGAVNLAGF